MAIPAASEPIVTGKKSMITPILMILKSTGLEAIAAVFIRTSFGLGLCISISLTTRGDARATRTAAKLAILCYVDGVEEKKRCKECFNLPIKINPRQYTPDSMDVEVVVMVEFVVVVEQLKKRRVDLFLFALVCL
eukprot:TRINITY_DN10409_c0_g1_i1.p1 TRINITY_DN10409_c0_g1~~TRINITY_DN10409_c0_g1_i1.p1  ORF type:complete len:135 (+),score=18.35 TRINITY_DN10409_c0_g1_i1:79-483(+)